MPKRAGLIVAGYLAAALVPLVAHADRRPTLALVPNSPDQDERSLLEVARGVKPETLKDGYQQYDLSIATVATWDDTRALKLRLLLPPGKAAKPLPVIAYIHGGGFIGGSHTVNIHSKRGGFNTRLRDLLDAGFSVASLDYRLSHEAGWPAPIRDTLCGLRFIALHGKHWNIDGRRIGICGHSAGARIVSLLATVKHDRYHVGHMPWRSASPRIAAAWLWAGSAWDHDNIHDWTNFGKPRQYSVPRMLFGEHPATDLTTRHRLRLRHNLPHLSRAMSPIFLLRGKDDYGGIHDDARRAVEIWHALGIDADMLIVPGGHAATGPTEALVTYFKKHLTKPPAKDVARQPTLAAKALIKANAHSAAIEVLTAANIVPDDSMPNGRWLILAGGQSLWIADATRWPKAHRSLITEARRHLADQQREAAVGKLEAGDIHGAQQAVRAAQHLFATTEGKTQLAAIEDRLRHETNVFTALAEANKRLHAGDAAAARALLKGNDRRIRAAAERVTKSANAEAASAPTWATRCGVDVYGRWADLALGEKQSIRLRWLEAGTWKLPDHLRYRNESNDPWVTHVKITRSYWLAQTETTIAQWNALEQDGLAADHSTNASRDAKSDPSPGTDNNDGRPDPAHPATGHDYLAIVDWLRRLQGKHPDVVFRLPSEQHWLHAATAGGRRDARPSVEHAAAHALSRDNGPGLMSVNATIPDLAGFQGMVGGVQEWTASPGRNHARFQGPTGGFVVWGYPIARGGSWASMPHTLGLHIRYQQRHTNRQADLGFRLMITDKADADWLKELEIK